MARTRWKCSPATSRSISSSATSSCPEWTGRPWSSEARKSRPELKILFMSGYAEEQLRNSMDVDNVSFLPKPFSVQELAEAAKRTMAAK